MPVLAIHKRIWLINKTLKSLDLFCCCEICSAQFLSWPQHVASYRLIKLFCYWFLQHLSNDFIIRFCSNNSQSLSKHPTRFLAELSAICHSRLQLTWFFFSRCRNCETSSILCLHNHPNILSYPGSRWGWVSTDRLKGIRVDILKLCYFLR